MLGRSRDWPSAPTSSTTSSTSTCTCASCRPRRDARPARRTLCRHSYAGAVVTRIADEVPDRIAEVVYLDAVAPGAGETVLGLTEGIPTPGQVDHGRPRRSPSDWVERTPSSSASLMTPHPAATIASVVTLRTAEPAQGLPRRTYGYAAGWRGSRTSGAITRRRGTTRRGRTEVVHGSHDLMVDRPDEVARIPISASDG
jgi:pimeloyl-ACP methyl ester carboxylesterase